MNKFSLEHSPPKLLTISVELGCTAEVLTIRSMLFVVNVFYRHIYIALIMLLAHVMFLVFHLHCTPKNIIKYRLMKCSQSELLQLQISEVFCS